jgi:hypothetical protein
MMGSMAGHRSKGGLAAAVFAAAFAVVAGCSDDGEADPRKVGAACRAAEEASVELDAVKVVGRSPDEVVGRFRRARRLADAGGAEELSETLDELIETIPDLSLEGEEHEHIVRIARIAHGVTGIVIACDEAGYEVTYSG